MTPLLNDTPKRSSHASELAALIAHGLMNIDSIKDNVKDTNTILAVCEIVISTPTEWYSLSEKACLVQVVRTLYKQNFPMFCIDIASGNVSFYNKVKHYPDSQLPVGSMKEILKALNDAHERLG